MRSRTNRVQVLIAPHPGSQQRAKECAGDGGEGGDGVEGGEMTGTEEIDTSHCETAPLRTVGVGAALMRTGSDSSTDVARTGSSTDY